MLRLKNIFVFCLAFFLASCSFFSSDKKLPEGRRVAVIDLKSDSDTVKAQNLKIKVSPAENIVSWPQLNANAHHLAPNVKASGTLEEVFSASFEHGASSRNFLLSKPIIDNGLIYAQDVNGTVYAFDLKDGKRVFRQKIKPLIQNDSSSALNGAGLASDGKKIYALTGFGTVAAIDALTGDMLWRKDLNVPFRTSPALGDGKLFAITIDNQLFALNSDDGSVIWKYEISSEDTVLAGGAAPAYDAKTKTLVAAFSNGEIMAFNARLGYPLFSNNLVNLDDLSAPSSINAVKASPVITDKKVIAVGNSRVTLAFDIENGDVLWQRALSGTQTPLVNNETIYLITQEGQLVALSLKDGSTLWQILPLEHLKIKERAQIHLYGPIMVQGHLVVTASDGAVYMFKPENGTKISQFDLKQDLPFAPIAAEQTVIFTTNNAHLIAFR